MLKPAGDDCSLFPGSTYITSIHVITCPIWKQALMAIQASSNIFLTRQENINNSVKKKQKQKTLFGKDTN